MFLEHGFDAVRVADVARACGVTEKTVFNHFRTKESLLADRWETQTEALCNRLSDARVAPVDAALGVLEHELAFMTSSVGREDGEFGLRELRHLSRLIQSTPSLVAHHRKALDQLTSAAAGALAQRAGTDPDDPRAWITATAIAGLWTVYYRSLRRHLAAEDADEIVGRVLRDLTCAADILREGI
jgi:AcrR family transcriptional regulator